MSNSYNIFVGEQGCAVVRALAAHQCDLGFILGPGVMCGLSVLLVLFLAQMLFVWVLRLSYLQKQPSTSKFRFDRESKRHGFVSTTNSLLVQPSYSKFVLLF